MSYGAYPRNGTKISAEEYRARRLEAGCLTAIMDDLIGDLEIQMREATAALKLLKAINPDGLTKSDIIDGCIMIAKHPNYLDKFPDTIAEISGAPSPEAAIGQ